MTLLTLNGIIFVDFISFFFSICYRDIAVAYNHKFSLAHSPEDLNHASTAEEARLMKSERNRKLNPLLFPKQSLQNSEIKRQQSG